jgi:hypothetical protein
MNDSYLDYLTAQLSNILNNYDPIFETLALNILRLLTLLHVGWAGILLVFRDMTMSRLLNLFVLIVITTTLVTYYTEPLPGMDVGFRKLVTDQVADMSAMITNAQADQLYSQFDLVESELTPPSLYDVLGIIQFLLVVIVLVIARAATLFAVSFGFLACATVAIFGPFFITFLLVPGMDWMFWGWLRSFIQYAFYPLVANAYTFIFSQVIIAFCNRQLVNGTVPLSSVFIPLLVVFVVYIYGIFKLPSLVNSMFSGRSGEAAGPAIR